MRPTTSAAWRASLGGRLAAAGLAVASCAVWGSPAPAAAITAEQAYARLARSGRLANVEVTGTFDLARLSRPAFPGARLEVDHVTFKGPVGLAALELRSALAFRQTSFQDLEIRGARLTHALTCDTCRVLGTAILEDAVFEGDVHILFTEFFAKASFAGSRFRGEAVFLGTTFHEPKGLTGGTSFSDVVFARGARFDGARFTGTARFNSTVFAADSSFLKMRVDQRALFRNVMFRGDAEFRHCHLGELDLGGFDALSVFHGLADFRGCRMGRATFDYAVFRGAASFVQVQLGEGGASFRHASFEGDKADFNQVTSRGPLNLNDAHAPRLHLQWHEVGSALLAARPPPDTLHRLHRRLTELGQTADALEAYYHFATDNTLAQMSRSDVALSERAWRAAELAVWGWPTGFGTRLGRIILVALGVWAALTVPLLVGTARLTRQPPPRPAGADGSGKRVARPRYEPVYLDELPESVCAPTSRWSRGWLACLFSFALMFRVPLSTVVYVETCPRPGRHAWERYFLGLWAIGAGLLALIALTLANTSPALKSLVGAILV